MLARWEPVGRVASCAWNVPPTGVFDRETTFDRSYAAMVGTGYGKLGSVEVTTRMNACEIEQISALGASCCIDPIEV